MKKKLFWVMVPFILSLFFYHFPNGFAQTDYPNQPVVVVNSGAPGSASDSIIRFYGEKWSEYLKQPVVTENRPGAGGMIGAKYAASAKPDGYTLYSGSDSMLITSRLGRKDAGYDLDSFRVIFAYSKVILYFSVKADSRWKTMNEFVSEVKQNPGKLRYASYGVGTIAHYAAVLLSQAAGMNMIHVPYKTSAEVLTALVGGHVDMGVTAGLAGMAGSPLLRPLAIAEEERVFNRPEVPTLRELGYPVYLNAIISLLAPKDVPDLCISKLTEAHQMVQAKYEEEIKEKIPRLNQYPLFMDGGSTMKLYKEREKRYLELAPQIGVKLK